MSENTRDHLLYTPEHEWVDIQDGVAIIGITPYAQDSLGDLVYVELPEVGQSLQKGEEFAVAESVKAASEVYAPLSGEVLEINEDLTSRPELINLSPYDDAWFIKLKLSDMKEAEELMQPSAYEDYIEGLV